MQKKIKSVITGDIIGYSKLSPAKRNFTQESLKDFLKDKDNDSNVFELYRGDSFQGVINKVEAALKYALLIRLKLKSFSFSSEQQRNSLLDARIAIGIGKIDSIKKNVLESDGEAFRNSGPLLDSMVSIERLKIKSPWKEFNSEFELTLNLLDVIVKSLTPSQSEVLLEKLSGHTQQEMAEKLKISQPAVFQRLKAAKWYVIEQTLKRYEESLKSYC